MSVKTASEGSVDRLYQRLKAMAVAFELKPDERVNESALAEKLGASRTPLREALNRLVAEGLLTFQPRRGFFCRPLRPKDIFDLYEARLTVEQATVRLACARAEEADLKAVRADLEQVRPSGAAHKTEALVTSDEAFHLRLAEMAGNAELTRMLASIQERIRFVRWIDMDRRRETTFGEHLAIVDAIESRDAATAARLIEAHVGRRAEQITAVVREGYSRIYIPESSF